jgi:hypothetical protein
MFWVFFVFWFGIFATIALIIVVNYRGYGSTKPELKDKTIERDELDGKAHSERSHTGQRPRGSGIVWSVVLWGAFLATVCVAALSQHGLIVDWMHEAWKTFLSMFP